MVRIQGGIRTFNTLKSTAKGLVSSFKTSMSGNKRTVLNLKTGKKEILDFFGDFAERTFSPAKGVEHEFMDALINDKVVGKVEVTSGLAAGLRANLPELYLMGENSLCINFLATSPDYKGVGRELVRKVVQLSQKLGFNGQVDLHCDTGRVPSHFMSVCGIDKCRVSSALKYRKMGFASVIPEQNSLIDATIKNGGTGMRKGNDLLSCTLHLPDDVIKNYLA